MRVPARVRRMGRRGARRGGGPSRNARRRKRKGCTPAAAQVAETARTCPFHNTRRPPPTTHHHFCFLHPLSLNRSFPTTTPPRSSTSSRCYRTTIHSFGFGASTLTTRAPQLGSPSSSTSPPSTLPPHTSPRRVTFATLCPSFAERTSFTKASPGAFTLPSLSCPLSHVPDTLCHYESLLSSCACLQGRLAHTRIKKPDLKKGHRY